MQSRLLEFAELLRHHGLRISPAESLDALASLEIAGLSDREVMRGALRATMIKRAADVPVFDELFDIYFSALGDSVREASANAEGALEQSLEEMRDLIARLEEILKEQDMELSDIAKALLEQDDGALEKRLREAMEEAQGQAQGEGNRRFRPGQFANALGEAFGLPTLGGELDGAAAAAEEGLGDEDAAKLREMIRQRMAEMREMMKRAANVEKVQQQEQPRDDAGLGEIGEKSFYYLTEDEIRRMKEAVAKLARRLRNVISVKRTRAKRGNFDLQRTLRHNIGYGGIPFDVRFQRKKKNKPQIVVLCDVSDSVRNVSRFMLQFVYALFGSLLPLHGPPYFVPPFLS